MLTPSFWLPILRAERKALDANIKRCRAALAAEKARSPAAIAKMERAVRVQEAYEHWKWQSARNRRLAFALRLQGKQLHEIAYLLHLSGGEVVQYIDDEASRRYSIQYYMAPSSFIVHGPMPRSNPPDRIMSDQCYLRLTTPPEQPAIKHS